jgi:hypothetical protein
MATYLKKEGNGHQSFTGNFIKIGYAHLSTQMAKYVRMEMTKKTLPRNLAIGHNSSAKCHPPSP